MWTTRTPLRQQKGSAANRLAAVLNAYALIAPSRLTSAGARAIPTAVDGERSGAAREIARMVGDDKYPVGG